MRVCPKCGYHDEPIWKNCRWGWDTQQTYCAFDTFKEWHPEIAETLTENQEATDDTFYYRLSKKGYVYRLAKDDEFFYHSHGYTENPKKKDIFQTKLEVNR